MLIAGLKAFVCVFNSTTKKFKREGFKGDVGYYVETLAADVLYFSVYNFIKKLSL